jgi:hypothetical protein
MSREVSLSSFLAAHPGAVLVHWPGPREPIELRELPRLGSAASADLVVTCDPAALDAALGALRGGGTLALVAPAGGLFGLFGARGPEGAELAEILLGAGLVELGMARVRGPLHRWCLVWGERTAGP